MADEIGRGRSAVLLLAHGAPEKVEDVSEFLLNVRGGRKLPPAAVEEMVRRYRLIGGGSPLLKYTRRQAEALVKVLGRPVYVGMRNWKPFIAEAVRSLRGDGVERVVAICLAPQNSGASTGLYRKHLREAVEKFAPALRVDFVASWHDHELLISAFREKISPALARAREEAGGPVPVIFTAHSVPARTIAEGDPYDRQVKETAARVAQALSLNPADWSVAYQSQGMTEGPWIGPTVESQIDGLADAGYRHVVIAPIGFVADHLEILYDVDVVFRNYGKQKGVEVWRSESLNDNPSFIRALASVASTRMAQAVSVAVPQAL